MKLVYKMSDAYAPRDARPPRWPNRPEEFALSAAPLGCEREWADVTGRADKSWPAFVASPAVKPE